MTRLELQLACIGRRHRNYPHPTWVSFVSAYSVHDLKLGHAILMIPDDFGTLVRVGYCYQIQPESEPLAVMMEDSLSFAAGV